jgi:hypothetical protein
MLALGPRPLQRHEEAIEGAEALAVGPVGVVKAAREVARDAVLERRVHGRDAAAVGVPHRLGELGRPGELLRLGELPRLPRANGVRGTRACGRAGGPRLATRLGREQRTGRPLASMAAAHQAELADRHDVLADVGFVGRRVKDADGEAHAAHRSADSRTDPGLRRRAAGRRRARGGSGWSACHCHPPRGRAGAGRPAAGPARGRPWRPPRRRCLGRARWRARRGGARRARTGPLRGTRPSRGCSPAGGRAR